MTPFQFGTVPRRSSNSWQMSKKYVLNEEKPRQTRPSIQASAMKAGAPPQAALAMEGLAAIALARAVVEATEETMMVMTTAATLAAAAVLVVMVVILAAATPEVVVQRGSRNTMLETMKPHGGLHFPPVTLVPRARSRRASRLYLRATLRQQRHLLRRSTCWASPMMLLLVASPPFLPRPTHLDLPHHSLPNLPLPLKAWFPLRLPFGSRLT